MQINLIDCVKTKTQLWALVKMFGFEAVCRGVKNPNHLFSRYSEKWVEWVEAQHKRKHHYIHKLKGASLYVSDNKIQQWYEWHKERNEKEVVIKTLGLVILPYYTASKKILPDTLKHEVERVKDILLGIESNGGQKLLLQNNVIEYVFGCKVVDVCRFYAHVDEYIKVGDREKFNGVIELCKAFGDISMPNEVHLKFFAPNNQIADMVKQKIKEQFL